MLVNSFVRIFLCFSALALLSACNGSLNVAQFPVPSGALNESLLGSETDAMNIVEDYSHINLGDGTADGSTVAVPTDAAQLESLLTDPHQKVFIRLPTDPDDQEHLYKSIRAASLRIKAHQNVNQHVRSLNLGALKTVANFFRFNAQQEKEYYMNIAKKINTTLKTSEILLVTIDDLPESCSPEAFLAELSTPNLLILSKKNFDAVQLFPQGSKSTQFFPEGLKISHIYRLLLARFSRSPNEDIKNHAEQLADQNAKVVGAMKPKVGLGFMASFMKKIEGYLDKSKVTTNYEKAIQTDLTGLLNTSPAFVDAMEFQNYTAEEIQRKIDDNKKAFTAISPSLALVQKSLDEIRSQDLPALKSQTDMIQSLSEEIAHIKTATNLLQSIKDDTNNTRTVGLPELAHGVANVTTAIGNARDAINRHTTNTVPAPIDQNAITSAVNRQITEEVNRARDEVNTHTSTAVNGITTGNLGDNKIPDNIAADLNAIKSKTNLIPDNFFDGNTSGIHHDTANMLKQLALYSQHLTFFIRNIGSELELIVRNKEKLGDSELSATIKERIRNATEEAIRKFLAHGNEDEVAQAASQGYAKSITAAFAANKETVDAIKNSTYIKSLIKGISDLANIQQAPRPVAPLDLNDSDTQNFSDDDAQSSRKDNRPLVERPVYSEEYPTSFPSPTTTRHQGGSSPKVLDSSLVEDFEISLDAIDELLPHGVSDVELNIIKHLFTPLSDD